MLRLWRPGLLIAGVALLVLALGAAALLRERGQPLSQAERRWEQQAIGDYRITVRETSIWVIRTFTLTVRDGQIVELAHTCQPGLADFGHCNSEPGQTDYTVPGLFRRAHTLLSSERIDPRWASMEFDPTYGFPQRISFNDPEIYDEEFGLEVLSFTVG